MEEELFLKETPRQLVRPPIVSEVKNYSPEEIHLYVVTLKNHEDLEDFYNDMETLGGTRYVPDREVECATRRSISRNTHYMLSELEAIELRKDPRVIAVEVPPEEQGIHRVLHWSQTGNYVKRVAPPQNTDLNWALYDCTNNITLGWGSDGTQTINGVVTTKSDGEHVDVVIVDETIDPTHPEFTVNSDGSGGSRVVQVNWNTYLSFVDSLDNDNITIPTGEYLYQLSYNTSLRRNDGANSGAGTVVTTQYAQGSHGAHVAGTVAGNTQGWARKANIYNLHFNGGTDATGFTGGAVNISNANYGLLMYDYLRAFHRYKPVNPATGRKNPTVTNHSYGYSITLNITAVSRITYNGVNYTGPFTSNQLRNYGLFTYTSGSTTFVEFPVRVASVDADIEDAITDGVIVVGAAGNEGTASITDVTHPHYNDTIWYNSNATSFQYRRGSSPSASTGVITVGNITSVVPVQNVYINGNKQTATKIYKNNSSNTGQNIDMWAPGTYIVSAVNRDCENFDFVVGTNAVADSRNPNYRLASWIGTSMAAPQVAGVVACFAQSYPRINNAFSMEVMKRHADTRVWSEEPRIYDVTASGNTAYTITQFALNSSTSLGNNPAITAYVGSTLYFNILTTGHPFYLIRTPGGGIGSGNLITGVVNQGAQSGQVILDTSKLDAGTYGYVCGNHSAMAGTITLNHYQLNNNFFGEGATSNFLRYADQRSNSGWLFPRQREVLRKNTGVLFPRRNNLFTSPPVAISMTLTSTTFTNNSALPTRCRYNLFGCGGSNTSPQLSWSVNSFGSITRWRLRCIDPQGGNWVHWSVDNIPVTTLSIPENGDWPPGTVVNNGDWVIALGTPQRSNGWGGACPGAGSGLHNYTFTVTGFDALGNAVAGASATIVGTLIG
jgi:phosphatidylethanolamine-binding protein (PEBP) family uncharacterized protein